MRKRIILSVAAVFFAVCTLLTGCGEDNSATPDSASGKAEGTTAAATTAAPTTVAPTTLPPTTVPATTVPVTTVPPTTIPKTTAPTTTIPPTIVTVIEEKRTVSQNEPVPVQTSHVHQWENITQTVHHPAEYKKVWVVDTPKHSYNATVSYYTCNVCGKTFSYDSGKQRDARSFSSQLGSHMLMENQKYDQEWQRALYDGRPCRAVRPEWIEKEVPYKVEVEEEGHYEDQVAKEAYDETVITGQRCRTCGEYK